MTGTDRVDRYGVMGNPIEHSKSPRIHRLFAAQTGRSIVYDAILVAPGRFADAVNDFIQHAGKGLNVTVPFKQDAWRIARRLSERAQRAGAVNTLTLAADGALTGDNTDGTGLVRDLTGNLGQTLAAKQVLVLGAGGAARGILAPLLEQHPARLVIANRTVERAQELAVQFADLGDLQGCGFADLAGKRFDIVINATAAGLQAQVPELPDGIMDADSCCYDLMYASEPTAFVRYAQQLGVRSAFDGLGMLVEQAAESFLVWHGIRPDTEPVIKALRRQ